VIRTTQELEAFTPGWTALWREDRNATPFQSPEWLLPWWRQFQQPDLRAVVITDGGRTAAFLPFYVYREPSTGERQLLLLGAGTSDYVDGVFAPSTGSDHVRAALDVLIEEGGWDGLYLSQIRPESILLQPLEQSRKLNGKRYDSASCSRMPARRMAELPVKIRRNAMYYRNRAMRLGSLDLAIADESNCEESFEGLQRLHTERWQMRGEPGVLADERVLAWHREAVPRLQRSGMLRLYSLLLNGEKMAFLYSLADPPWRRPRLLYVYLPGHAAKFAELRPGTVLLALATESAANECMDEVDLLRGEEAYKQIWHPTPVPTYGFAARCCGSVAAGVL
jgi:CelD/BcsL family acetyltransferase involved in cellulose biosynthesis